MTDGMEDILAGLLAKILGEQKSRIDDTRYTHPELFEKCSSYALENVTVDNITEKATVLRDNITVDVLVLMNSNLLETMMKYRCPKGPVALMVVLAEWLNEHPTVMMEIESDPRWLEVRG